jgi:hypothetical protein
MYPHRRSYCRRFVRESGHDLFGKTDEGGALELGWHQAEKGGEQVDVSDAKCAAQLLDAFGTRRGAPDDGHLAIEPFRVQLGFGDDQTASMDADRSQSVGQPAHDGPGFGAGGLICFADVDESTDWYLADIAARFGEQAQVFADRVQRLDAVLDEVMAARARPADGFFAVATNVDRGM